MPADRFARYKETTLRDMFYIIRVRLHEPGWIIESKGSDVIENRPVEIVDLTDANNLTTTVYFDQITKLPVRQVFFRRDPVTKDRNEEVTHFTKYRDARRSPVALRHRARPQRGKDLRDFFKLRGSEQQEGLRRFVLVAFQPSSC